MDDFVILPSMKPLSNRAFEEAYAQLNNAQKQAVDTIDGPVLVVAGPGTGKTQILTLRIANILLRKDIDPENILALTFTDSGAKAMRERLRRYIGATAYRVPIFTFHGFAEQLIAQYPDAYQKVIGGRPASDIEKVDHIERILNDGQIKLLRPMGNPEYYVFAIIRTISQLKQEYITPDAFSRLIAEQEGELEQVEKYHEKGAHKGKVKGEYAKKEKAIAKNRELLHVYRQYDALLAETKLYDFDDMIVETVKALSENEDMLRDLQERYQFILADEHQDVNGSQNRILELLASFHDSPDIFAVGDEKQAIYRFQGASLENFLAFKKQFKGTTVVELTQNYRSGQSILDAAHSLVAVDDGPAVLKELRVPLTACAVAEASVDRRAFVHQAIEDDWLVAAIGEQLNAGTPPQEIAVIVRSNREVEELSTRLRKAGIKVTASADGDVLKHPITSGVQALIDAVVSQKNEEALFRVLHGAYWGISPTDLVRLLSARSYTRSLWELITDEEALVRLGVQDTARLMRVGAVIEAVRKREVTEAPHRVLEFLLQESGFLAHVVARDPLEGTRVLRRVYDEIEELVVRDGVSSLTDVSRTFSLLRSYHLKLNAPFIETDTNAVQVMTAHKSKGLEFAVVFVPHLTDRAWSGAGKRTYFDIPLSSYADTSLADTIEDERRLLYVAMTRAKRALHLSSSELNSDGKERTLSRLVADIDESLLALVETQEAEAAFDPVSLLQQTIKPIAVDPGVLTHLLAERGFSATSLNNYLKHPWDYFYRNVLRIPETQAVHMQFGTAVHNTLEYVTRHHTANHSLPSESEIKLRFERELGRLPIGHEEYTRLHEKGFEALLVYTHHLAAVLPAATREELTLRVHLPTGLAALPEVVLTGKLDRIDLGEDGRALRVIDYKTGKPKTRNVIEGNTASSDGAYKRQLVFYALLLSLYDDERYRTHTGVLSFVEPDAHGRIREESFTITPEEIESLKTDIVAACREICSGAFLDLPCEEGDSEYSQYVALLRTNENSA